MNTDHAKAVRRCAVRRRQYSGRILGAGAMTQRTPRTLDEIAPDAYGWLDGRRAREARSYILGAAPVIYTDTSLMARALRLLRRVMNRNSR